MHKEDNTFFKNLLIYNVFRLLSQILDEVYTILNYIKNTPTHTRPYRVTDELFDLSTMAMEYFRERIEATLPDIAYYNKDYFKTKRSMHKIQI